MLLRPRRNRGMEFSETAGVLNLMMVEFAPEWENVHVNLARLDALFQKIWALPACGKPDCGPDESFSPDVIVLPECFSTGFSMNPEAAERMGASPSLGWMLRTAGLYDCAVAGSVPVWDTDARRHNRFFFVTPDGVLGSYDKRHLFMGGEAECFAKGNERVVLEYKGWRICPGVCFDLRFPVWSRNDMNHPYDLYLNVANWPAARRRAAETLIEARAIENVCYAAFCNRSGRDINLEYSGGSAVINHRGRLRSVSAVTDGTNVVYASLDMAEMLRYRASFPVLDSADKFEILLT